MSFPVGELVGIGNILLCGINVWQWAMAGEYDSKGVHHPLMKRVFLLEAVLNLVSGLYLILMG